MLQKKWGARQASRLIMSDGCAWVREFHVLSTIRWRCEGLVHQRTGHYYKTTLYVEFHNAIACNINPRSHKDFWSKKAYLIRYRSVQVHRDHINLVFSKNLQGIQSQSSVMLHLQTATSMIDMLCIEMSHDPYPSMNETIDCSDKLGRVWFLLGWLHMLKAVLQLAATVLVKLDIREKWQTWCSGQMPVFVVPSGKKLGWE